VERTLAWLDRFRRLATRYERRLDIHHAFTVLACYLFCIMNPAGPAAPAAAAGRESRPRQALLTDVLKVPQAKTLSAALNRLRSPGEVSAVRRRWRRNGDIGGLPLLLVRQPLGRGVRRSAYKNLLSLL
jgi:hypothetical protein